MSESLHIECPVCQQHSTVPASYAGKLGKCPGCLSTIRVPGLVEPVLAPPVETAKPPAPEAAATVVAPMNATASSDSTAQAPAETPTVPVAPPPGADSEPEAAAFEAKTCPYCGESIREAAKKCRFCGTFLDKQMQRERRTRKAPPALKWAFPMAIMILLPLQSLIDGFCAIACAVNRAEEPSGIVWGFSAFFSFVYLVTMLTPFAHGNRLRILALIGANVLHFVICGIAITSLNIRPSPPSPLLATFHGTLAIVMAGVFFLAVRARSEASRRT